MALVLSAIFIRYNSNTYVDVFLVLLILVDRSAAYRYGVVSMLPWGRKGAE
jgi:hypothetical protein